MQAEPFMYFCIKNYIGTQDGDLSTVKCALNPSVVYATDCFKTVVWCYSYFVWLFNRGRFMLSLAFFPYSLFYCLYVFSVLFSIVTTSLGEERTVQCASRICVYFSLVNLSFFSSFWCQRLAAACDCGTP